MTNKVPNFIYPVKFMTPSHILIKRFHSHYSENASFCNCSRFCCKLLYVHSCFAMILMGKRELVALLSLSSLCLVIDVWLFLPVPWVCLQLVIVVFSDHTYYFSLSDFKVKLERTSNSSQSLQDECFGKNYWPHRRFHSKLQAGKWNFCPLMYLRC